MKPVIGVTIHKESKNNNVYKMVNAANINAIYHNGGIPIMLPINKENDVIDSYLEMVDGFLFTGGTDINPLLYGEEPVKGLEEVDYDRDEYEFKLCKKVMQKNKPILAICRGMQMMNVASGGTLYQDIYSQRKDTNLHNPKSNFGGYEFHHVNVLENSKLYNILNLTNIMTNSYHHQAIKDVAEGFVATAYAKDGIIEAIESTNLNFAVGVQWHPEVMYENRPLFNSLFKSFIQEACKIR